MPLYHVTVEMDLYVVADDEHKAEWIAERKIHEESHNASVWVSEPVTKLGNIMGDWIDCRPYGDNRSDLTVRQIVEAQDEAEKRRPPTPAEIEAAGQVRLIP